MDAGRGWKFNSTQIFEPAHIDASKIPTGPDEHPHFLSLPDLTPKEQSQATTAKGDLVSSRLTWVPIQCPQERHKWEWERRGWVRRRSWRWRSPQSLIRPYRLCECQIWKWTAHHMTFSSCLFTKVFFWSKSFWYLFTPKAAMGPVSKMTPANIDPTNEAEPEPAWRMIQTYIIYSAQRMIISQVWAETIHERNFQSLHI